jgi:hypothetical protein
MTDATLAERLARCVKPLAVNLLPPGDWSGDWYAQEQAAHTARILAALDMDALAQEVEAMVGAEREACAQVADDYDGEGMNAGAHYGLGDACQTRRDIATAIRAREGGKP